MQNSISLVVVQSHLLVLLEPEERILPLILFLLLSGYYSAF